MKCMRPTGFLTLPDEQPSDADEKGRFLGSRATWFRLVPAPRPPEGTKPDPHAYEISRGAVAKVPGMAEHFERDTPGMHTSESVDTA